MAAGDCYPAGFSPKKKKIEAERKTVSFFSPSCLSKFLLFPLCPFIFLSHHQLFCSIFVSLPLHSSLVLASCYSSVSLHHLVPWRSPLQLKLNLSILLPPFILLFHPSADGGGRKVVLLMKSSSFFPLPPHPWSPD